MQYHVDLHAIVNGDMSVREGHEIAHDLKDYLRSQIPNLGHVLIHIEPAEKEVTVRYRIDGILRAVMTFPRQVLEIFQSRALSLINSIVVRQKLLHQKKNRPKKKRGVSAGQVK